MTLYMTHDTMVVWENLPCVFLEVHRMEGVRVGGVLSSDKFPLR